MRKANSSEKEQAAATPADSAGDGSTVGGTETQFSVETEEAFESEDEELSDTANQSQDGRVPLRIEEECKTGRFKRVHDFRYPIVQPSDWSRHV